MTSGRVWSHSREDFHEFVQTLISHHSSIKVEPQVGDMEINFLDETLFNGLVLVTTGLLDYRLNN